MTYPRRKWRLLITPPSPGAWNMAVDEVLLASVEGHMSLPCLRLYAWQPPCLSIGYAQVCAEVDLPHLKALGWDCVRRPTGGRAILHTDELTYSVIAPTSDPRVSGGVLESYQRLSRALLSALHNLGIPAESHPQPLPGNNGTGGPVCFEVPSNYEIVVHGKKIVGSAQARRKYAVLQHGTFPLWGDLARIIDGLTFDDDSARCAAATRLLDHATTAEAVLGARLEWQVAAQAFISAFQSELDLDLVPTELTMDEKKQAEVLMREKYAHPSWLERI